MQALRAALLSSLLAGCAYELRPEQPPADVQERQKEEAGACWRDALPAWLDDTALSRAARLDHAEAQASTVNDGYQGYAYLPQPPEASGARSRVSSLLDERREFRSWCALLRSGGKDFGKP